MRVLDRVAVVLGTGLGSGFFPFAPGTVGSLLGPPMIYGVQQASLPPTLLAVSAAVFILVGIPICTRASQALGKHDPGQVVYDEIAAFWIVFLPQLVNGESLTGRSAILGFLLFRVFDIWKPWPVSRLEKLPDGTGIMADDLAAGAFAAVCLVVIERLW
jgi:phosphatidylglycerophosphatase A